MQGVASWHGRDCIPGLAMELTAVLVKGPMLLRPCMAPIEADPCRLHTLLRNIVLMSACPMQLSVIGKETFDELCMHNHGKTAT